MIQAHMTKQTLPIEDYLQNTVKEMAVQRLLLQDLLKLLEPVLYTSGKRALNQMMADIRSPVSGMHHLREKHLNEKTIPTLIIGYV